MSSFNEFPLDLNQKTNIIIKGLFVCPFPFAAVAQLVEQLTRNEQVVRSNRISSSKIPLGHLAKGDFYVMAL